MHENEFTVNVKDLEDGPVTLQVDCDAKALDLSDPEFEFDSRVTGDVAFSMVRPRVVGRGTLTTEAKSQCVRCLQEARIAVSAPVNALYENEKQMRDSRTELVTPEEQIVTPYNGDWIQPENELREAIMLELPTLPLCSPDCKGLCPRCGANLNEGPCACQTAEVTDEVEVSPWKAAIKSVKLNSKE